MENKSSISVSELRFCYEKDKEILHGISADFAKGKITALIGANGCGKSTLLNVMAGVLKLQGGKVLLNGNDVKGLKRAEVAKNIAVVHQSNIAPEDMMVRRLVSSGRTPYRKLFKPFSKEDEEAVEKALADTDTLKFADRPVSSLSGGQLQRVWLAMALAQDTDILLLDEITTYLDVHYQLEILHLIKELNRKKNLTVVMVLHDINLAFEYCDEVVVMKAGFVSAKGKITDAVNEQVLSDAFDVTSEILKINGQQHCIFSRKEKVYGAPK